MLNAPDDFVINDLLPEAQTLMVFNTEYETVGDVTDATDEILRAIAEYRASTVGRPIEATEEMLSGEAE